MSKPTNCSALGIEITNSAISYFVDLLTKEPANTNFRITLTNPGTIYADVKISFCPQNSEKATDVSLNFDNFTIFIEETAITYLQEAKIDYTEQDSTELLIKAPHLKKNDNDTRSLTEKIQCVIDNEINPILEAHGGMIALEEVLEDSIVLLRFGGGCCGCHVADVTFQQTVERILRQHFPELKEIRNVTDWIETN